MVHYGQEVRDGASIHSNLLTFSLRHTIKLIYIGTYGRYDFGPVGNMNNYYGQRTPPPYDAAKVLVPVMTFWGDNDWLVDPLVRICFE